MTKTQIKAVAKVGESVCVTWEDAYCPARSAYACEAQEITDDYRPHLIETIGYLCSCGPDVLVLAFERVVRDDAALYRSTQYIPFGMVRKVKRLR